MTGIQNDWEPIPVQNLIRYAPSGTYHARFKVGGELFRRSLQTQILSVAKLRLADALKDARGANEQAKSGSGYFRVTKRVYQRGVGMNPPAPCCPTCGSAALVKSGHHSCGSQQYLCHACGAHRVLAPKRPATDPARQTLVLQAVTTERLSLRAAERLFGVARQTIARWLERKAASLPPLSETLLPAQKGDVLELDEL